MKKILLFIILLTAFDTSAFGTSECEYVVMGTSKYGCDSSNYSSVQKGYGSVYQVLGTGKCHTQANTQWSEFTNKQITCTDKAGSDDLWARADLNVAANSPIKHISSLIDHAIYKIPGCGELTTEQIENGEVKVCTNIPAIITCQLGYVYDAPKTKCIPTDEWINSRGEKMCKESSTRHKVSNTQKELKTGDNTYLYCYTYSEINTMTSNVQFTNSCLANMHKVRIGTRYYDCTLSGWTEHQFSKCASGGDFDTCTGIEHCTEKVIDNSNKKEVTTATGTNQLLISDTGSTYCIQYACEKGYTKVGNICKEDSQIAAEERKKQIQQTNKSKCINSGGTWSNVKCVCSAEKHLISADTNTCACQMGYEYNATTRACDPTNKELLRQACNDATDTTWDAVNQQCVCNQGNNYVFNSGLKKCEATAEYVACMALGNAATWDAASKQCKCRDPKQEMNTDGTACVETAAARAERLTAEATQRVNAAYANVKAIHDKFRDDVSVWKNAEGKFNTARLASDGIAGVVLGTTGGLITSKIIKKNQIEDGFENLRCTIGGQDVAAWGDQFNVGIQ